MSRTPIHPGEILGEELEALGISSAELSRQLLVPENRVGELIRGKRSITADTALRLAKWFGTTASFWMNLQKSYELRNAELAIASELEAIRPRSHEVA